MLTYPRGWQIPGLSSTSSLERKRYPEGGVKRTASNVGAINITEVGTL